MTLFLAPPPHGPVTRSPEPSFSVVIAAYQAADTIGEAVESALTQSTPPLEVIVFDDGSTDDIEGALAPFRERVLFLRGENRGPAAARNAAFGIAKGEFVVILDADDVFLPDRLAAFAQLAATRPDLDILTTDALVEVGGRPVRRFYDENWTFDVEDQRRAILQRNFIYGEAAVRREALLAIGGMDESFPINPYVEDWDLWIRLIMSGSRAGLVAKPLIRYRVGPGTLSAQREHRLVGKIAVLEKALRLASLSPAERKIAEREAARMRSDLLFERACRALLDGTPEARRRCIQVVLSSDLRLRGLRPRNRLRAAGFWLAPGWAGRRLRRAKDTVWEGPGGTRLPSGSPPAGVEVGGDG